MALPCNNLNLNLYRVFYTVAKTKSFSESSRVLHISQPAISKHIQNLEYELNTLLFYRTNRGIELTPEAKSLLIYVEKAYNYLMLGERELQEGKELTKGTVSIGIPSYISIYYLKEYIKKFMELHPNIIIKLSTHDESILLDSFDQHSLDFLIISGEVKINRELKVVNLINDKYCFAVKKDLEGIDSISTLEELTLKNLLLPTKDTKQRKILDDYLNTKGLVINPLMECETIEMIVDYIKEGMGIGYIPRKVAELNDDLKIIEIKETMTEEIIKLVYNESTLTNTSKQFINSLINNEKL